MLLPPSEDSAPNLPGQWLQCQANGSNVCRVLRLPEAGPSCPEADKSLPFWSNGGQPFWSNMGERVSSCPEAGPSCPEAGPGLQGYLAHKKTPPPLGPP